MRQEILNKINFLEHKKFVKFLEKLRTSLKAFKRIPSIQKNSKACPEALQMLSIIF